MRDKIFREQRKAFRKAQRKEFARRHKRSGSVLAGLLFLCIGTVLLLKAFGVPIPDWVFTWPMIIVAFGLLAGAGNSFRDPGWVIICGVGTVFLLQDIWPEKDVFNFIWPVVIIALGFIIILAPRRRRMWHERWNREHWNKFKEMREMGAHPWERLEEPEVMQEQSALSPSETTTTAFPYNDPARKNAENWLDVVTIFGNAKKLVYSKNFKGGDIVSIFGGAEINLTNTDFNGNIVIELVQIFGGTKLIVPPHWQIRSESVVAVFGGIEDKRPVQTNYDEDKVVILNGTTLFGGIEIKSF
jgi:hypothetical protein